MRRRGEHGADAEHAADAAVEPQRQVVALGAAHHVRAVDERHAVEMRSGPTASSAAPPTPWRSARASGRRSTAGTCRRGRVRGWPRWPGQRERASDSIAAVHRFVTAGGYNASMISRVSVASALSLGCERSEPDVSMASPCIRHDGGLAGVGGRVRRRSIAPRSPASSATPRMRCLPKARVTVTSLATGVATTATTSNDGVYLVVNLMPGDYLVQAEATGLPALRADRQPGAGRAVAPRSVARGGIDRRDRQGRRHHAAAQHRIGGGRHRGRHHGNGQAAARRFATGTICWRWCPACRATATPSRPAAPPRAAPAASACTAIAACRTTSSSTAWPTTASRPTCRS